MGIDSNDIIKSGPLCSTDERLFALIWGSDMAFIFVTPLM